MFKAFAAGMGAVSLPHMVFPSYMSVAVKVDKHYRHNFNPIRAKGATFSHSDYQQCATDRVFSCGDLYTPWQDLYRRAGHDAHGARFGRVFAFLG